MYIPENANVSPEHFLIVQCLHDSQIFHFGAGDIQSHALTMLAEKVHLHSGCVGVIWWIHVHYACVIAHTANANSVWLQ